MTDYRVTWEADVEAENPQAAARLARLMQTRAGTIATVFDVFEEGKEPVHVDLTELDEGEVDDASAALGFMAVAAEAGEPEDVQLPMVTASDLATIFCALRMVQRESQMLDGPWFDGGIRPLDEAEIDDLCERLNCGGVAQPTGEVWAVVADTDDERRPTVCLFTTYRAALEQVLEFLKEDATSLKFDLPVEELTAKLEAGDYAGFRDQAEEIAEEQSLYQFSVTKQEVQG